MELEPEVVDVRQVMKIMSDRSRRLVVERDARPKWPVKRRLWKLKD